MDRIFPETFVYSSPDGRDLRRGEIASYAGLRHLPMKACASDRNPAVP
jgi:hypothetical protein